MIRTLILAVLLAAAPAAAVSTNLWSLTSYDDFIAGEHDGTAVSTLGRLELSPAATPVAGLEAEYIWRAVPGRDGELYLTAGETGRLLRVQGKVVTTLLSADTGFYALAVDANGAVFAGSFPGGAITRWTPAGAAQVATLPEKYIWDLCFDRSGALYAACGLNGSVYRIDAAGRAQRVLAAGPGHILCLAAGPDGSIYAGTAKDGLIYRIAPDGAVTVLADLPQQEIIALVCGPDGQLYAGINPKNGASGSAAAAAARALAAQMRRRVAADSSMLNSGSAGEEDEPDAGTEITAAVRARLAAQPQNGEDDEDAEALAAARARARARTRSREAGGERGASGDMLSALLANCAAVYRVQPNGTTMLLYVSDKEIIHDFAVLPDGTLWVATGKEGKLFRVTPDEVETCLLDFPVTQVTALAPATGGDWWLATGNGGKLFRVSAGPADSGVFTPPVFDAKFPARWGTVRLLADRPAGVQFRTRAGMTETADTRWSDWSDWQASGAAITSPGGRYLELQVRLTATGGAPLVREITASYVVANQRPMVLEVKVDGEAEGDEEEAGASRRAAAAAEVPEIERGVMWQAADPDGDALRYNVYVQGERESAWRWLNREKADLTAARWVWNTADLADGLYYIKVVASDRESNADAGFTAEKIVGPYTVDNSLPAVQVTAAVADGAARVVARLQDAGCVAGASYSVDNGPWRQLAATDGFFDSPGEQVEFAVPGLARGEHVITVRARDAVGHEAVAAATVTVL
ncbi:MAG TPA: hypothetical protein PKM88_06560 [bacterium]|nr:hypothetical protein [bacterium]